MRSSRNTTANYSVFWKGVRAVNRQLILHSALLDELEGLLPPAIETTDPIYKSFLDWEATILQQVSRTTRQLALRGVLN